MNIDFYVLLVFLYLVEILWHFSHCNGMRYFSRVILYIRISRRIYTRKFVHARVRPISSSRYSGTGRNNPGGEKETTENGRHFKAFCGKHGRALLENSWLMQVPRYRTACTPFASLLLWSIWICHCVKLSLPVLSLFLSLSLTLFAASFTRLFLSFSFSRSRIPRSSKFLSVHLSARPLLLRSTASASSLQICDASRRRAKVH